jgi:hypothetical protein
VTVVAAAAAIQNLPIVDLLPMQPVWRGGCLAGAHRADEIDVHVVPIALDDLEPHGPSLPKAAAVWHTPAR